MPHQRRDERPPGRDDLLPREERIGKMRKGGEMRELDLAYRRPGRGPGRIAGRIGPDADELDDLEDARRSERRNRKGRYRFRRDE